MRTLLILNDGDEVGVCLEAVQRGTPLELPDGRSLEALTDIPAGHKVALRELPEGTVVHKYGQAIGRTSCGVLAGEHVHVQNLDSLRAGGTRR